MSPRRQHRAGTSGPKAKKMAKPKTQRVSPFLTLPPELRNRIYDLTMPENETIHIRNHDDATTFPPAPAFAFTCKAIYAEYPLKTYYARNTLHLGTGICKSRSALSHVAKTFEKFANAITNINVEFLLRFQIPAQQPRGFQYQRYGQQLVLSHGSFKLLAQASFQVSRHVDGSIVTGKHSVDMLSNYPPRYCECKFEGMDGNVTGSGKRNLLPFVQEYLRSVEQDALLDLRCTRCLMLGSGSGSQREGRGGTVRWL